MDAPPADYLYGEITESTHGRQPGTLAALAMNREKKTRAVLAEMGITPENATVTKKAAKEALMERMSKSKDGAKSASELFLGLPTSDSLAKKALAELFSGGKIQRVGKGTRGEPFRYFTSAQQSATRLDKRG